MSTENLYNQEGIAKIREIIDKIDIGMLGSYPANSAFLHAVPMSRQEVDDAGNIWYLFSSDSESFFHIRENNQVSLLYSDPSSYTFLSINGSAEISSDRQRIEKYWNKMMEGWFDAGIDDPRIRVLKVAPEEAQYWDTKSNKLVTLWKAAVSAVTGVEMDKGRSGEITI